MSFFNWIARKSETKFERARSKTTYTPRIERLEDRCTPSAGPSAEIVADIVPGPLSSAPYGLTNVNGSLYFGTDYGIHKSDGTAAGTVQITSNVSGSGFTPLGGSVLFYGSSTLGSGVYKTDGTEAGTIFVKQVRIESQMTIAGGKAYFVGHDGSNGSELWVSDGTAAGTKLVKDMYTGSVHYSGGGGGGRKDGPYSTPHSSFPRELTNLNGTLYFTAENAKNGRQLWRSDGTAKGTVMVTTDGVGQDLATMNGVLYFGGKGGLWRTNGSAAGTFLLKASVSMSQPTNVNGTLFFISGVQDLWKTDGTAAGTVYIKTIGSTIYAYYPENLTAAGNTLFFTAYTDTYGRELWRSDGTAEGTVMVKDIVAGKASAFGNDSQYATHNPWLTNVNGLLYFTAGDTSGVPAIEFPSNIELWQSDGTEAGTMMVRDIFPGSTGSDPSHLVMMNNKLYFAATDPEHGRELWDPPAVEPLDTQRAAGGEQLFLGSFDGDSVVHYDAMTGDFIDTFVPKHSGGLNQPYGMLFGPHDNDLYVSTGQWGGLGQLKSVLRFDGDTGDFVENFTKGGDLESPRSIIFGPDGDLYVADKRSGGPSGRVARYDGLTGDYLGDFVPWLSGGLKIPTYLVFGPSDRGSGQFDLYVTNVFDDSVLRFNGTTGAFIDAYVPAGSGGLDAPMGLTFGPDENLYVASAGYDTREPEILRFQGLHGATPGAFIDAFVPAYSTGKRLPFSILFGPDGNGDGQLDLYVNDAHVNTGAFNGKDGSVKRFDGATGALIDTLVPERDHGLQQVGNICFTRTDPVTLAYILDSAEESSVTLFGTSPTSNGIVNEGWRNSIMPFIVTLSSCHDSLVSSAFHAHYGAPSTSEGYPIARSRTPTFLHSQARTQTITSEYKRASEQETEETFDLQPAAGAGSCGAAESLSLDIGEEIGVNRPRNGNKRGR